MPKERTRRDFLKCSAAGLGLLGLGPLACLLAEGPLSTTAPTRPATPATGPGRPPNIVLILADDMGWKDVGYNEAGYYETPNIDRLAKQGVTFTQAYACAGNCAPSRACLISGQYTPRHGVYAVQSTSRGPAEHMRLVPVKNRVDLAGENVTVAEALKAAGYATAMFGKWHLSRPNKKDAATEPEHQGFDMALQCPTQGGSDDPKSIFTITKTACAFIERNKDKPFFAYVAHHAIHSSQEARPATLAKFKAKPAGKEHGDDKHSDMYAACTYDLDESVGILLKKIDDLGLADNTLVIFTSDNGGVPSSSQEPLRGAKGCYYEGGIRVPMVVRWPGHAKAGGSCDVPVANMDFYPTFLAASQTAVPTGKELDGESLLPLLPGDGSLNREAIFWHFPGYLNNPVPRGRDKVFRCRPVSVIRKGAWKLHLYHEEWALDGAREKLDTNKAVELYNIADDIGERKDLALVEKRKRDELLADLLAWIKRTKAPMASEANKGYDPTAPITQKGAKDDGEE